MTRIKGFYRYQTGIPIEHISVPTEEEAKAINDRWREMYPEIKATWKKLSDDERQRQEAFITRMVDEGVADVPEWDEPPLRKDGKGYEDGRS